MKNKIKMEVGWMEKKIHLRSLRSVENFIKKHFADVVYILSLDGFLVVKSVDVSQYQNTKYKNNIYLKNQDEKIFFPYVAKPTNVYIESYNYNYNYRVAKSWIKLGWKEENLKIFQDIFSGIVVGISFVNVFREGFPVLNYEKALVHQQENLQKTLKYIEKMRRRTPKEILFNPYKKKNVDFKKVIR